MKDELPDARRDDSGGAQPREVPVVARCIELARQTAVENNHSELTFAHLLLAMTQVPEACDRLRELSYIDADGVHAGLDIEWASQAATALLATLDKGPAGGMVESSELKTILSQAEWRLRQRSRNLSSEPIAVRDILVAALQLRSDSSACRILKSRRPPPSPMDVIRNRFQDLKNALWGPGRAEVPARPPHPPAV